MDVHVNGHTDPLATWQFEFTAVEGEVAVVGIEGGEHPAFQDPPYYDRKAIQPRAGDCRPF